MASERQTDDQKLAAWWKGQIEQCDKETDKWHKRGEKISRHYRDERDDNTVGVARRLNLFWSNTETLKPAIYSKVPVPICERRFLDKDTTGRVASTILERNLRYEVQMAGFDGAVRKARNDYLLVGRGQVWIRYFPLFGEPISPAQSGDNDIELAGQNKPVADDTKPEEEAERELLRESLAVDYLHWQDYYTFPAYARTEEEIEGKGRKLYMSRSDLIEHFGEKIGKKIDLDHKPGDDRTAQKASNNSQSTLTGKDGMQATIYEIWWKPERKVYFVAKSHDDICKEVDDPLKLDGFFPCPAPLNATTTNDTTLPVPDYAESQDQYAQIDDLTKRIDILTGACKVIGVYDAGAQSLKRVFEEAQEPNLIPVDSWAMFAEKGGLKSAIDWVPIEMVAKVLQILIEVRAKIIEDLDRMTGISDIMRGTSDARETMGAQRLKTNNSSTRIQERQDDMARFCRDIICIMGEIISEQYRPETLIQVSGALYDEGLDPPALPAPPPNPMMGHNGGPPMQSAPPAPAPGPAPMPPQGPAPPAVPAGAPMPASSPGMASPQPAPALPPAGAPIAETDEQKQQRKLIMIMQAIGLLKSDKLRGFRIDIETDSTVQGDAQQEKAQRIEFVEGVTKFIEAAGQVAQSLPEFTPLAAKMLGFAVRGFRVGRDLESAIEEFCDSVELKAKANAGNPQPNPEQIKAETEKMKAMAEIERQKVENEGEQANNAANLRMKEIDQQMEQMRIRMAELKLEETRIQVMGKANEAGEDSEAGSTKGFGMHPVIAGEHIVKAANAIDLASRRNAAPKRIVRGPDGRATHVVTDFQEQ
jgi:hypothetical protein